MKRNIAETILGAVVLIVAIGFITWAYGRSDVGNKSGYLLNASFDNIGGLQVGSDVQIAGIKIGQVVGTHLDQRSYRAVLTFSVESGVELPSDSSAAIVSASLLGGRYLSIVPGGDVDMLADGDTLTFTQSAVSLEELIGKYIFGSGGGDSAAPATPGTPPAQ